MYGKKHIVWFTDIDKIDLNKKENRMWWLKQVLLKGRMEDIRELDFDEVERLLPDLYMPHIIKRLWEDYFEWKRKGTINIAPAGDN